MSTFAAKACACMCAPLTCALILSSAAIVTMVGVLREMELRNAGSGKRFHFAHRVPVCENMTAVTLVKVADCLANEQVGVEVPFELQDPAKKTLELMLEYAAR